MLQATQTLMNENIHYDLNSGIYHPPTGTVSNLLTITNTNFQSLAGK